MSASVDARLDEHIQFFDRMVDMIPASYYYPATYEKPNKFHSHNKTGDAPKQKSKESSKRGVKAQNRFDPANYRTVVDVQQAEGIQPKAQRATAKPKPHFGGDFEGLAKGSAASTVATSVLSATLDKSSLPGNARDSVQTLRERLQEKIVALSGKRKHMDPDARASKKQKTAEKRKAAAKEKAKAIKKAAKEAARAAKAAANEKKQQAAEAKAKKEEAEKMDFTFGSVKSGKETDFTALGGKKARGPGKQKLLARAQAFDAKIAEVREHNSDLADQMLREKSMEASMLRAAGVKVKDNAKLLSKALKKKERSSQHSKAAWKEISSAVSQGQKDKQKKRAKNLEARMTKKKNKNQKKAKKRAGFEGASFLN